MLPFILTFIPIAEHLAVELSLPVFMTFYGLSRQGFEHPTFGLRGERFDPTALELLIIIKKRLRVVKSNHKSVAFRTIQVQFFCLFSLKK